MERGWPGEIRTTELQVISRALDGVFKAEWRAPKPRKGTDPCGNCPLNNLHHPEVAALLAAREERNMTECDEKVRRIGADS